MTHAEFAPLADDWFQHQEEVRDHEFVAEPQELIDADWRVGWE